MQDKKTLLRQKWIEALESGEYEQVRHIFHTMRPSKTFLGFAYKYKPAYCALGLYDHIAEINGFLRLEHLGLDLNTAAIMTDNDSYKLTFKEIAAKLRAGEYDTIHMEEVQ